MTTHRRFTNPFQLPGTALAPSRFQNPFAATATPVARPARFQNPFAPSGTAGSAVSAFDQPFAQSPTGAAIGPVVVGTLNLIGTVLQPLQGVQQGLVMAPLALATGRPGQAVSALKAGASYLGYGSLEQLPGFEKARANDVKGRTIFKNVGAPDWLADSAGLALDFFGDPTILLGGVGLGVKAAGNIAKVPRVANAGQSIIRAADELGAPVRTVVRAIPKPVRERIARNTWKYAFGVDAPTGIIPFLSKTVGRERASIAELILPPEIARRLAPEDESKVIDFVGELKRQEQKTLMEYGERAQALAEAFGAATGGLPKPKVDAAARILASMEGAPTRKAWQDAREQLKGWASSTGDPARYERALKAYGDGVRFDLWAGQALVDQGKLGPDDLLRNLAFPGGKLNEGTERRGTIRRAFSFFDDPDVWLDKLRAENRPARVSLEPVRLKARLEQAADLMPVTTVPGAPPPARLNATTAAAPGAAASVGGPWGHRAEDWTALEPWKLGREDFEVGKVPGWEYNPLARYEARAQEDGTYRVGPSFFESDELGRRLTMQHEIGHRVASSILKDSSWQSALAPLRSDVDKGAYTEYRNPYGLANRPEEILADAYADLLERGGQADAGSPNAAIMDLVRAHAVKLGLPDRPRGADDGLLPLIDLDRHAGPIADLKPGARVAWSAPGGRRVRGIVGKNGEIERVPYTGPKPGRSNLVRADDGEPIARGKRALLSRLDFEVRKGELDADIATAAREFARMLPDEYLAGVGTSFHKVQAIDVGAGRALGVYDPETAVVAIAKLGVNASAIGDRSIVHELAHHLEAFVPAVDRQAMRGLYEREAARNAGRATGNAGYRYSSFQEWFAENITDRALRDVFPEGPARSLFERVARVIRDASVSVYNWFLRGGKRDSAELVYKNLIAGKYGSERQADDALGGSAPRLLPADDAVPGAIGSIPFRDAAGAPIDPRAELLRRLAAGKAAKDVAFKAAIKATPDALVASVQEFFTANPEAPLADGLAHAIQANGITDARRATAFIRAVLDDADPGMARTASSRETVWKLQERLLEQDAVTVQGGGAPGSLAVGATRVSARKQLTDQILQDYGRIEDYRALYDEQARVVGEVVARRTALDEIKRFMIDEGGMYWPQLAQQINAGRLDSSKLPAALDKLPVDPSGFKVAGGFRTITVQDARGLDGVFSAGDVVPDSLYRVITAGKNVKGAALPVMLRVLNNDWKGIKIGNPATALVNILSAIPMSDHYGIGLGELVSGAFSFATKSKRAWLDEMTERGIGNVDGLSNEVRLEAARLRQELARAPMTGWDKLGGIVKAYFDFTGESIGTRPGSMAEGPARTLARFGNPLTGFGLTRGLLNSNQLSDNFVRGSVYHAKRAAGASPDEAATAAREVLLDYAARPLLVEFGSKSGLDPFATFRYLSAYRVLSTMYDRPARLARYYRVADSLGERDDDPERRARELAVAQDYVREKQPTRLGTDSSGRGTYMALANYFPEGTVTDLIDDPNASNFLGIIPKAPLLAAIETVSTGVGFRGMNPYDGLVDKGGFFEAFAEDKVEAVRRALKVLWRYGASPMAPGTPAMEEIARSIAKTARTTEQLADDAGVSETVMREALKVLEEGPFAWGRQGSLPVAATRGESLTGEPARDLQWSIARALGIKTYDVQGDLNQPGAARNLIRGGGYDLRDRQKYLTNLLAKAKRDGMPEADYQALRASVIEELQKLAQELTTKADGIR